MNDENQPERPISIFDAFFAEEEDYRIVMVPLFASVIVDDMPDHLRELRFFALKEMERYLQHYEKLGYRKSLICTIARKKGTKILEVTSKEDMQKLLRPRCPHYDGNRFVPDPFSIPEEEMICWSETSLRAPLSDIACKRYLELFQLVYPIQYSTAVGEEMPL